MIKYAYIYSMDSAKNNRKYIPSMQLTICKYIKNFFDPIEIKSITKDIIDKYDVICLDHFAINDFWVNMYMMEPFLNIIANCKNICLLTRDLHEWTFFSKGKLRNKMVQESHRLGIPYVPTDNIGIGYQSLNILLNKYNIKNIISIYDCTEFNNLVNYTNSRPYILPLHVDTNIFKNMQIQRDIDILIYGSDCYQIYPLRNRLKQTVSKMNVKSHIIKSTEKYHKDTFDDGLAKLLNRSWLCVCTCSVFDYLVLKYFEASACGAVVIGNMASQGKPIWQDNYIDVPPASTDEQISNIILDALSNKEKLSAMSKIMSDKIIQEYNYDAYSVKLNDICDKLSVTK